MNTPTIGLAILAAGASTRMGTPKQLLPYQGNSLLRHIAKSAIASPCEPIVVVLGADAEQIKPEISDLPLYTVENQQWMAGMGTSIRAGLTELTTISPNLEAVVITLCDQPFVSTQLLDRLVKAYHSNHNAIVACEYAETLGVPALFSHTLFTELMTLDVTKGAKQAIAQHIHEVYRISFPEGAIDIDTPQEYEQLSKSKVKS